MNGAILQWSHAQNRYMIYYSFPFLVAYYWEFIPVINHPVHRPKTAINTMHNDHHWEVWVKAPCLTLGFWLSPSPSRLAGESYGETGLLEALNITQLDSKTSLARKCDKQVDLHLQEPVIGYDVCMSNWRVVGMDLVAGRWGRLGKVLIREHDGASEIAWGCEWHLVLGSLRCFQHLREFGGSQSKLARAMWKTICPDVLDTMYIHGQAQTPDGLSSLKRMWWNLLDVWPLHSLHSIHIPNQPKPVALKLRTGSRVDTSVSLMPSCSFFRTSCCETKNHEEVNTNIPEARDKFTAVDQGPYVLRTTFFSWIGWHTIHSSLLSIHGNLYTYTDV